MPKLHEVGANDCFASVAFEHGFLWQTLWDHPENRTIRELRSDAYVLMAGDTVYIPDIRKKTVDCDLNKLHTFVRRGTPERMRLIFVDDEGAPRNGGQYILSTASEILEAGVIPQSGILDIGIAPNLHEATIEIEWPMYSEVIDLEVGKLDPFDTESGVIGRLSNLGHTEDGVEEGVEIETQSAFVGYQRKRGLSESGEFDSETMRRLHYEYGF